MIRFSFKDFQNDYQLRHEPERFVRFARLFWILALSITIVIVCVSIGFGIFQFLAPPSAPTIESAQQGIAGFNRAQLTSIVEAFGKRNQAFELMMVGE